MVLRLTRGWLFLALLPLCLGCGRSLPSTPLPTAQLAPAAADSSQVASQVAEAELREPAALVVPKALDDASFIGPLADAYRRLDPRNDGWDSEAFGELAVAQLNRLAQQFVAAGESPSALVSADFQAPSLWRHDRFNDVYHDDNVVVRRTAGPLVVPEGAVGPARLQQLIGEFRAEYTGPAEVKFKLYRIATRAASVETMAIFHASGTSETSRKEITATCRLVWEPVTATQPTPRLQKIEAQQIEVVEAKDTLTPWFVDCTASILAGDGAYERQLRYSTDHWRSRLGRDHGLDVVANHGLAIGDVDGDMLEDLYLCQQGGLPNRLFIQQADGTLQDQSAARGVDWLDYSASALLVDLDNDADKDLVVAHELRIVFMRNDGRGNFQVAAIVPSRAQTFSLAAADFDLDGYLDIYCCGYNPRGANARTGAMGEPIPYHDAQNGGPNLLLRRAGDWDYVNATEETGLEQNNNRFSFAASWEDYDNDGDPDLYVANDYGRNNLYRNDGGRFTDVAKVLQVEDMSAGMSISWADINRDGWMDFHVSNMFSAAGNRITFQRQFMDSVSGSVRKQFQRHARGNSLFLADGRGGFRDVSETAGITMGRWAWGSTFCDMNNDGWQDIVVNNGFITTADTGDL